MLKSYKKEIIFFYLFSAAALISSFFVDLKLNIFLNNPSSAFAIWFRNTGEMPARLLPILAGTIIFHFCESKKQKFIGLFVWISASVYFGYHIARYFFVEENNLVFGILFGLGFGAFVLFIGRYVKFDEKTTKALIILSFAGVIVMLGEVVLVESIKFGWGRVRFRDLLAAGSYDAFSSWVHPNGINGHKSFPSGHTSGAGMSYLLMLLPYLSEKLRKRKTLLFIIAFIFTGTVAFTRLVMGAHYLSDVTVGGAISFTCVLAAIDYIDSKKLLVIE